jgi:hypothetical protein
MGNNIMAAEAKIRERENLSTRETTIKRVKHKGRGGGVKDGRGRHDKIMVRI